MEGIKMPTLTASENLRYKSGIRILDILSNERSVVAKPMSQVNIRNIPDTVEPAIRDWIKKHSQHEIYGSGAMKSRSIIARTPADMDLVINNPKSAVSAIASIMQNKGIKVKIESDPKYNAYKVQIQKQGKWVDSIDIHPTKGHYGKYEIYGSSQPPTIRDGMRIQKASDQLLRKARSVMGTDPRTGKMEAPPARRLKDTIDFITTAKLLIASKKLKGKAEYKRAMAAEKELKVWEKYLKSIEENKGKKKITKKKQISKTRHKQFINFSLRNPTVPIEDIVFERTEVKIREDVETALVSPPKKVATPYYKEKREKYTEVPYRNKETKKKGNNIPVSSQEKRTKKKPLINRDFLMEGAWRLFR